MIGLVVIPTAIVYGLLVLGVSLVLSGKWPWWTLLIVALPFVDWTYEFIYAKVYFSGPDPIVAALRFSPPPTTIPTTLAVEDPIEPNSIYPWVASGRLGIEAIVFTRKGCDLTPDNLKSPTMDRGIPGPAAPIPDTYLLIKADKCARPDLPQYGSTGYYRELHLISPGSDQLLGAYFRRLIADPIFPPMLILNSWFGTLTQDVTKEPNSDMTQFLMNTLGYRRKPISLTAPPEPQVEHRGKLLTLKEVCAPDAGLHCTGPVPGD